MLAPAATLVPTAPYLNTSTPIIASMSLQTACVLCLTLLLSPVSLVQAMTSKERQEFMNAIRPEAVRRAGQPVRFKVDRLNQDGDWVLMMGSVIAEPGKRIDWDLAQDCDPHLDKLLWVVAKRADSRWQVKHLFICSPEPPHWYLKQFGGFVWPCGIYKGLDDGGGQDLEEQCRHSRTGRPRR